MSFALDVSKWVNKANVRGSFVLRHVALDLERRVVLRTPVDTGRARANWNVAVNHIDTTVNALARDKSGEKTINRAVATVQRAELGDVIVISNNLNYIEALEGGGSSQAPNGMVDVTLQEYQRLMDTAVRQSKRRYQ